jgi:hypothetical protein
MAKCVLCASNVENHARVSSNVCSECHIKHEADIGHVRPSEILENGDKIEELIVVRIRKPTADGNCVLWVENVGCWGVVDDDCVFEVTSDLGEVLHIVALVVVTALTEKPMVNNLVNVKLIQERVAVLRDRRRKDHHFIKLANPLHELINTWTFDDVDIVVIAFNFNRNREIGLVQDLFSSISDVTDTYFLSRPTLKELCTSVSSKSKTRHFLPRCSGLMGPSSAF